MAFDGLPSDYEVKKPDVFSPQGLIAWLEMQPATREYDWWDMGDCLVCHYLAEALGTDEPWHVAAEAGKSYEDVLGSRWAYHAVGSALPWTYGAALDRARALSQGRA